MSTSLDARCVVTSLSLCCWPATQRYQIAQYTGGWLILQTGLSLCIFPHIFCKLPRTESGLSDALIIMSGGNCFLRYGDSRNCIKSLTGTVSGALATPLGTLPFSRFDTISDSVDGFGDVVPIATLRWNAGVHNYMTYITGDIPVGTYSSSSLVNIGIGHGAIDAGGGYTYLNPQIGHEFSGVLGFTYNFTNQSTQYQNGVDMHFDWAGGLRLQRGRLRLLM